MGEQMHERKQVVDKYLEKLSPADQKAMKDEMAANHKKAPTSRGFGDDA